MHYKIKTSNKFNKSLERLKLSDQKLVMDVADRLSNDEVLERRYKNHKLKGNMKGIWDCHIHDNLVLLYKKDKKELILTAIDVGAHEYLGI